MFRCVPRTFRRQLWAVICEIVQSYIFWWQQREHVDLSIMLESPFSFPDNFIPFRFKLFVQTQLMTISETAGKATAYT